MPRRGIEFVPPLKTKTLLASAARTASTSTADQFNNRYRGVMVFINITANGGGSTTLRGQIQTKDPASDTYNEVTDFTVSTAESKNAVIVLYPGVVETDARGNFFAQGLILPRVWRVTILPSTADAWTYSVSICYLP